MNYLYMVKAELLHSLYVLELLTEGLISVI